MPLSRPSGEYQLIVVQGGSEFGLTIRAELQHTLVAEIGCISKVIHFVLSRICPGPVEIFYGDIYTIARIFRGIAEGSAFLKEVNRWKGYLRRRISGYPGWRAS